MTRHAFSLVELSIVLVILGLLTGGILAGQSLIRASQLRSIGTDLNRYQTAHYAFRDKYFQVPGDFSAATSIWGALDPAPNTCATLTVTGTATCNGNGDSRTLTATGAYYDEVFHYWVHLVNAGMVEGRYTGKTSDNANLREHTPGTNSPLSRIANAGFAVWSGSGITPSAFTSRNLFVFGGFLATSLPSAGVLSAQEQWNLDTKLDDALPLAGRMQMMPGLASCGSSTAYTLTNAGKDCAFAYVMQ